PAAQGVERVARRIDADKALLLAPDARRVITATDKGWMQRRFNPHRIRAVARVVWFCASEDPVELKRLLAGVHAIGRQVASGYGRVEGWERSEEHTSELQSRE